MRNLFFLFSIAFFIYSCKKERTCSCTVSTDGTRVTRSQTAGIKIDFPPLPPVEVTPAKDTTTTTAYNFVDLERSKYSKVSKNTMRKNCVESSSQTFHENSSNIVPGTSTVTTTDSGMRTHTCKIE